MCEAFPYERTGITTHKNIVFIDLEPVGILRAGSCFHQIASEIIVLGPHGTTRARLERESVLAAMIATGALILGKREEVEAIRELLESPLNSRNVAFLSVLVESCSQLLSLTRRVREAHITVLGCGGIGSLVAILAAGLGVQKFTLIDGDRIEMSNLNRQIAYELVDVGRFKTQALRQFMARRYEGLCIETHESFITPAELGNILPPKSIAVVTADTPLGAASAHRGALDAIGVEWIDAGYFFATGIVVESPSTRSDRYQDTAWRHFRTSIMPSSPINNAILISETFRRLASKIFGRPVELPLSEL